MSFSSKESYGLFLILSDKKSFCLPQMVHIHLHSHGSQSRKIRSALTVSPFSQKPVFFSLQNSWLFSSFFNHLLTETQIVFSVIIKAGSFISEKACPKNLLVVTYASALIWILVVISFTSAIKAEYISISIPTGDICGCSCFIRYACTSKLLFTSSSSKSCSLLITNLPHNIFSFAVHYISYVRLNYNSIYGRF